MKITLSSQKKQSFEVEVDQSSTLLDLKKLIIEHFGYPEDSISSISIVVKQIIVRDMTKTLFDLNIAEGSLIYFFAPAKLVATKSSDSISKPVQPKASTPQQSPPPQNKPEPEVPPEPQNPPKPEKSQNLLYPKPSPPSADYSWSNPIKQTSFSNIYDKKTADPRKVEMIKEMGFDDRHATIFLRASLNNLNMATEMMTNPFYQDESNFDRLEKYINNELSPEEVREFQKDHLASEAKEKGLTQSQAEAQLKWVQAFSNLAQAMQNSQKNSTTTSSSLYKMQRQQIQQQQMQQLTNQFKQMYEQHKARQQNTLQKTASLFLDLNNMFAKVKNAENVPIDQYENPFIEFRQLLVDNKITNTNEYRAVDTAAKFDRDQVIFISHNLERWEEAISILDATEGDIEAAREIMAASH